MPINPLLVVHGVGNRSQEAFKETTQFFEERSMGRHQLVRVFWGDLGGIAEGLEETLPSIFPGAGDNEHLVRGPEEVSVAQGEAAAAAVISARVTGSVSVQGVRSREGTEALQKSIADAVAATQFIKTVGDVEVLNAVGDLVATAMGESDATGTAVGGRAIEVRSWSGDVVKAIIKAADQMVGRMTGNLGGTFNQLLRKKMAVPISLSFGDVVAYHQNRAAIHQRLFESLDREAPGWGTEEKPVNVMAHSLGGLLVLDAALAAEGRRLWIDKLVTFGSQPAFFHVMAPRMGLKTYEPGHPVALPASVKRWTNLWHRMDVLAFVAKPVFRLSDGTSPVEVDVTSDASEIAKLKGWLHSCYWESAELLDATR